MLLVGLVLVAGCSGSLLESSYEFHASPATVDEAAQGSTGFEHQETRQFWINRTRDVRDQEVQVNVSNHAAVYTKSAEFGGERTPYAGFVALTSPEASILGQPMNPLARLSNRQLVERARSYVERMLGDQYGELRDVREVGSSRTTILGEETEVSRFRATGVTSSGTEVEAVFLVTKVTHGGDVVVLAGAYPVEVGSGESAVAVDESDAILTLMGSVSHEE